MKRQAYYPTRSADQIVWLENFRNKLSAYMAALSLTAGQVAAGVADARWVIYVLGSWLPAVRAFAPSCTDAALAGQTGDGTLLNTLPIFAAPVLPAASGGNPAVVPVNTGALNRIFALIATIKSATGYTEAIGTDLGVVGSVQTAPDMATVQPVLDLSLMAATVFVGWGWGGNGAFLDMLELQVDRGTGQGFIPLAFDTTPNYTDTFPFPATPVKWKYRAIYRVGDAQVGLWSNTAEIVVGA